MHELLLWQVFVVNVACWPPFTVNSEIVTLPAGVQLLIQMWTVNDAG